MKNEQSPSTPCKIVVGHDGNGKPNTVQVNGLTKLEYASIMAMQGMLANPRMIEYDIKTPKNIAIAAIDFAQKLFEELEKENR